MWRQKIRGYYSQLEHWILSIQHSSFFYSPSEGESSKAWITDSEWYIVVNTIKEVPEGNQYE